jgi:hypothetical protein
MYNNRSNVDSMNKIRTQLCCSKNSEFMSAREGLEQVLDSKLLLKIIN